MIAETCLYSYFSSKYFFFNYLNFISTNDKAIFTSHNDPIIVIIITFITTITYYSLDTPSGESKSTHVTFTLRKGTFLYVSTNDSAGHYIKVKSLLFNQRCRNL